MDRTRQDRIERGKANRKAKQRRDAFEHEPNCGKMFESNTGGTNWQLNRVDAIEWTQDDSGLNVLIAWDTITDSVRLDVMADKSTKPLQSFIGKTDDVRKAAMRWLTDNIGPTAKTNYLNCVGISIEHAAYIGAELERCDTERIDYEQN